MAGLVKGMRTCWAKDRRDYAVMLARLGFDEYLDELQRMVAGEKRTWLWRYDKQDQLIGLEALAESHDQRMLDYLNRIAQCERSVVEEEDRIEGVSYDQYEVPGQFRHYTVTFPYAPPRLAELLRTTNSNWLSEPPMNDEELFRYNKAVQALHNSIATLEEALAPAAVIPPSSYNPADLDEFPGLEEPGEPHRPGCTCRRCVGTDVSLYLSTP